MISAIVLTTDGQALDDVEKAREVVVRSLVWLVSAVVSGVVREVSLAVPAGLGLSEVADQSGCGLVQAEAETDRLAGAVAASREERLLVMRAGYQPDARLVEEIESFVRRESVETIALVLAAPETAVQRLLPDRAPIIGVLLPRAAYAARPRRSFAGLARLARRGKRLRSRAEWID